MQKQIKPQATKDMEIRIRDAAYPAPFAHCLEFNSPAHGTWNIVHTGMLVPEAQQIYVCAYNCMRGVVLTAAEMNEQERFSFVILDEEDMIAGKLEDITIEGVAACIHKLNRRPPVVLLFTVCVHQFLGCDLDYIYRKLEEQFPDIYFARCFMDCLFQKKGPTPDQKLRMSMYDPIQASTVKKGLISLIGSDLPLLPDSDLSRLVREAGGELKEVSRLKDYPDFQLMGASEAIVVTYPSGRPGGEKLAGRLERPFLYLPMSFDYQEIAQEWRKLVEILDISIQKDRIQEETDACEAAVREAYAVIGQTRIAIDYTFHPRPLGLARFLLEHGFLVEEVYLDGVIPEEEQDFFWLKEHRPELKLIATMKPECRVKNRDQEDMLAIGQKAAWFTGTFHFVNVVQGGGLFGFDGIQKTMGLMKEAFLEPKDPKKLIIRKGWGCKSCI